MPRCVVPPAMSERRRLPVCMQRRAFMQLFTELSTADRCSRRPIECWRATLANATITIDAGTGACSNVTGVATKGSFSVSVSYAARSHLTSARGTISSGYSPTALTIVLGAGVGFEHRNCSFGVTNGLRMIASSSCAGLLARPGAALMSVLAACG